MNNTSQSIRTVKNRTLWFHQLESIEPKGVDGVGVLNRAGPEGWVVEADPVDKVPSDSAAAGEEKPKEDTSVNKKAPGKLDMAKFRFAK